MKRKKITIEYPLSVKSPNIIWGLISNAAGLQKWMADYVSEENSSMTFTWGEAWTEQDTKVSRVLGKEEFRYIRLQWEHEHGDDEYWELRIEESELTGELNLVITDFSDDDETEYMKDMWSDNLDRLHNISGL